MNITQRQLVIPAVAVSFALLGWFSGMVFADPSENAAIEKQLHLSKGQYVAQIRAADLNNDGLADQLVVYGSKENAKDIYMEGIQVALIDGKSQAVRVSGLKDFAGYEPNIADVADFTGDGLPEIFVAANTGGSGGYSTYAVLDFSQGEVKNLLTPEISEGLKISGKYADHFKAELTLANTHERFEVNFESRKAKYIEEKIYDASGKFLGIGNRDHMDMPNQIDGYPFGSLEAIDWDGDGISELRGSQRLLGVDNTERLSEVNSILKYDKGQWQLIEANFSNPIK